jgi:hypothetical protein
MNKIDKVFATHDDAKAIAKAGDIIVALAPAGFTIIPAVTNVIVLADRRTVTRRHHENVNAQALAVA